MQFQVISAGDKFPRDQEDILILQEDNWDDWFTYNTMYSLYYINEKGEMNGIGSVKIGQKTYAESQKRTNVPQSFEDLPEEFFSLGQESGYYEKLMELPYNLGLRILDSLRDVAKDSNLFREVKGLSVVRISLMRNVSEKLIKGRFNQVITDGLDQTPFSFRYNAPSKMRGTNSDIIPISFEVRPNSIPPSNVHALIGRNGVGKTHLLNAMIDSLIKPSTIGDVNVFEAYDSTGRENEFTRLVSVSFSAFDDLTRAKESRDKNGGISYEYIGLKKIPNEDDSEDLDEVPKTPDQLASEFVKSAEKCLIGSRRTRINRAIEILSTDRVFRESRVNELFGSDIIEVPKKSARAIFRKLSSGHKVVLLTIVKLVETVEDRTLVIIDEPESHLHPPLLAALTRALSDLLANRNAVAIVATHSPVIVQEIPSNCVWKMYRNGNRFKFQRPEIETFAEGYGTLSREIFGLEVSEAGYNQYILSAIEDCRSFEEAVSVFSNKIGTEGLSLIRCTIASPEDSEDE